MLRRVSLVDEPCLLLIVGTCPFQRAGQVHEPAISDNLRCMLEPFSKENASRGIRGKGMDECVRKVTELEICRLVLGLDRPEMAIQLELYCEEGGGINARTLRRWEARLHKPFRLFRRALCKYFNVASVAQLGLGDTFEAARWWTWMTEDEWTEEVNRRKALEVLGETGLLLPVSKLTAAAQLLEGRTFIGAGDLATATQTATDIAAAYADTPNADVIRSAKAHAYTLLDLLDRATMRGDVRTRLEALASDAACLVGYGEMNAGRLAEADGWFEDALKLARQAGDRRLEAFAIASRAWPSLYAVQLDRVAALEVLEAAAAYQWFLPPAGRAWVFGYLAREHAALKDDLVSGRFLEQAQIAAALIRRGGPGSGWWSTQGELGALDSTRLEVFTGRRSLLLGRPADALALFDRALDNTTAPVFRAGLHDNVIGAYVALDEPDRACASAHAALDERDCHGIESVTAWIRRARMAFPKPWATLRPVIELDERLALAR
jgi:tetratricopeptide (TPR) repeat protein